MTNQFIRRFFDPAQGLGAANPLALGLSAAQTAMGIVQTISGSAKAKRLQQMVQAYQTPDEVYKILNATENLASQGYDPATLSYLTGNIDEAFASSASVAKRLGADANTLSSLFSDRVNAVMKVGAENHALNMENFSKYISALDTVSANKAAEQKSKQDIIKDQIQAAVADKQAGLQNIGGGINAALGTLAAGQTTSLYNSDYLSNNSNSSVIRGLLSGGVLPGGTSPQRTAIPNLSTGSLTMPSSQSSLQGGIDENFLIQQLIKKYFSNIKTAA